MQIEAGQLGPRNSNTVDGTDYWYSYSKSAHRSLDIGLPSDRRRSRLASRYLADWLLIRINIFIIKSYSQYIQKKLKFYVGLPNKISLKIWRCFCAAVRRYLYLRFNTLWSSVTSFNISISSRADGITLDIFSLMIKYSLSHSIKSDDYDVWELTDWLTRFVSGATFSWQLTSLIAYQ